MKVTHLVCTPNFAGVERHIAVLAAAQHDRGHEVTILGGDIDRMREVVDRPRVNVLPVNGVADVLRLLAGPAGTEADVVATHMTAADISAACAPGLTGTAVVSTRHFAATRGSTPAARAAAAFAARRITTDIAVSQHIATHVEGDPVVVLPGVPDRPDGVDADHREPAVLVVQRLEEEKSTDVALAAFAISGLADRGWTLQVVGDGSQRSSLEDLARQLGVDHATDFQGQRSDIPQQMSRAGLLLAPCPSEGLGLAVVEAMSSGLPVVASAAGGHLESAGPTPGAALFPVGDAHTAGVLLAALADDPIRRSAYGVALRDRQRSVFAVQQQVAATEEVYRDAIARTTPRPPPRSHFGRDLVVISLEPWDRVWRRNQHLVAGLLRMDPGLRVLFVEPATDPLHAVRAGNRPHAGRGLRRGPHLPGVGADALWLLQPTKYFPRRVDSQQDRRWAEAIVRSATELGFTDPTLWVNDPQGSEVLRAAKWPALYDITDDWLEADRDDATHARLVRQEATLFAEADEVVVCSPGLVRTKSRERAVTLLQNAVDVDAVSQPVARPIDLPQGPVAVYVGTLHSDRLDVGLCEETARAIAGVGALVLVGPDALTPEEGARLTAAGVVRHGPKDRRDVPGYLQHADVLVVPHIVDDFTDSLDPIKLYEYRAVGRPVVSTPVAGFREAAGTRLQVIDREHFAEAVAAGLPARDRYPTGVDPDVPTWADRVAEMRSVIDRVAPRPVVPGEDTLSTDVPLDVRVRLGHAAVQHLANEHGLDVLHIKGDALDEALVHPGRHATDADVLVRPAHLDRLLDVCAAAGYRTDGRFSTSSPFEHSTTLWHDLWGYLDVHRHYPGIGLAPAEAFQRMWTTREHRAIAEVDCPTPHVAAQVGILVLHAGRTPGEGQPSRDVEHAWHGADATTRDAVGQWVTEMRAQVAFAAGTGELESLPPSPERDLWAAVTREGRVQEWRARIAAAPDLRTRALLVARAPLVNTDHLATRLGHTPSRVDVARDFVDRIRRGAREILGRGAR